jgi:flagellin-like hook-associated protein FlgL
MPVTIGSNIASLTSIRVLSRTSESLNDTYQRLSSGQRINKAADDAAGLSVSSALTTKSRVFAQGIRNINDGISLTAIAEGALNSLQGIVTRIAELAEQSANGTFSSRQRAALDREADSLIMEYNRVVQSTQYNGNQIIDGNGDNILIQNGFGAENTTRIALSTEFGVAAGDGTFTVATSLSATLTVGTPTSSSTADFNNDGVIDLAASSGTTGVGIYLGNGNGSFKSSVGGLAQPGASTDVVAGDFNGDGNQDVVTTTSGSNVYLFLGNGNGSFKSGVSFSTGSTTSYITASDFNGDGSLDIATSNSGAGNVNVLISNGNGTFRASTNYTVTGATGGLLTDDMNGDGTSDLIVQTSGATQILYANQDGSFGSAVSLGSALYGVSIGDFNNDGKTDVAGMDSSSDALTTLLGNGNGTFQAAKTSIVGGASAVVLDDFNGDGSVDMQSISGGVAYMWKGLGDGTFTPGTSTSAGPATTVLVSGDFNSDGVRDFIGGSSGQLFGILGYADASGRRKTTVDMLDLKTIHKAREALTWANSQREKISKELALVGASQSRLSTIQSVLDATRTNYIAAASRISDTDVASEAGESVRLSILRNTGAAVLAQANVQPEIALRLLSNI